MAGRPKGSTGHQNKAIKDMILASLDEVGGKDYFVRQAMENPTAYLALVGKVVPKDLEVTIRKSIFEELPLHEQDGDSEATIQ